MVHIPDDDAGSAETPNKPSGKSGKQSAAPKQQSGKQQKTPSQQVQRPPGPAPKKRARANTMISLEPPKRRKAMRKREGARMDAMAGPATNSARMRMVDNRKRNQQKKRNTGNHLAQNKSESGRYDMGMSDAQFNQMIVRRKHTRRIPKKGGGLAGEGPALDSMSDSGRSPAVPPPHRAERPTSNSEIPPVVNMPVRQANIPPVNRGAPPEPGNRGNTLAGVSAEDLLGDEGRRMIEEMRQRETNPQPAILPVEDRDTRKVPQQPTNPDGSLAPVDGFLEGPTRMMQRSDVAPAQPAPPPQPVPSQQPNLSEPPPPDDLGYDRDVDFGDAPAGATEVADTGDDIDFSVPDEGEPAVSEAQDEMELRAGYLLWLQGVITEEEIIDSVQDSEGVSEAIVDLIEHTGFVDHHALYRFLARHEGLAPVDLQAIEPNDEALAALRPSIARAYRVVPIAKLNKILLLAASFPFEPQRMLELRSLTACKVKLYIAPDDDIEDALQKYYPSAKQTKALEKTADADDGDDQESNENEITGHGEKLAEEYDPTMSGEDSGLYAPMEMSDGDASSDVPDDVALAETGASDEPSDEGATDDDPLGEDINDTLDDAAIAAQADLEESTLDQAVSQAASELGYDDGDDDVSLGDDDNNELQLGDDDSEENPEDDKKQSSIDVGPEDLDPFAD